MQKVMLIFTLLAIHVGLMALSGFGISPILTLDTVSPQVELLAPNGGEQWYVGDLNSILWIATDSNLPGFPIDLMYSPSGGADYVNIAVGYDNAGAYPWQTPNVQSTNARVKIIVVDAFGHASEQVSAAPFSITYAPPQAPQSVEVSLVNTSDLLISWEPVTQTIYGTPVTPDGYLIFTSEDPDAADEFSYLWFVSQGTSFTHAGVAQFRDRMFYNVIAYKDFSGRMNDWLTTAALGGEGRRTLADIKIALQNQFGGGQ